jgi:pyridoxine 4-dehydrogenase
MRHLPRFQPGVFDQNLKLVEAVERIAAEKAATVVQVAMTWVRRQGAIPIPGTTTVERLVENCTEVNLSEEDMAKLQDILDTLPVIGERYGGKNEKLLNL